MLSSRLWILALAVFASLSSIASAEVKLPAIFSDGMVLQQGLPLTFWGTADASEAVSVSVGDQSGNTKADGNGLWKVKVPAVEKFGPVAVKVNNREFKDVLIGDVWICSGQSNMEWSIRDSANPDEEIKAASYPEIRFIKIPKTPSVTPLSDTPAKWEAVTPQSVEGGTGNGLTAVGYYFGRELHKKLNRPIGLIHCAWGGTIAEAWTSPEALQAKPQYAQMLERAKADNANPQQAGNPNRASMLYNGMLKPIMPFPIKGAIWYQGESNAGRAYQYRSLFADMIADWRQNWGEGEFPFYFVQLASFITDGDLRDGKKPAPTEPVESSWAELREAQSLALGVKNTGQAVTIDIGAPKDIHPKNKQDVGLRLALNALHHTYGQDVVFSGPTYKNMAIDGNKIRLQFDNLGGGLVVKDGLKGFAICGADHKFVWGEATIEGDTVVVVAAAIKEPIAVRYGWDDNPPATLFNKAGLPASPFRTDDFPATTVNNQ